MSAPLTYQQTLHFLYEQLPMFQRLGDAAMKKDLGNTLQLCAALGNPERRFKSIHIAGTNGKGSTAHLLSAALQASDYRVGLYTSPHYKDFRERIKINGQLMQRQFVVDWVQQHQHLFESIQPSFFEITVAMAFDYFAQQKVDVAVIETGLGGRLDSTNVITPELSIITNISYDHQQFLGDTLEAIAGEKAGIIKAGVPVVIGETQEETKPVFLTKAKLEKAPITFADEHFRVNALPTHSQHLDASHYQVFKDGSILLEKMEVQLKGDYQRKNLATVLQATYLLQQQVFFQKLSWKTVQEGFADLRKRTRFMGRWQVIGEAPTILCDSAHNEGGLRQIFQQLHSLNFRKLHIILGVVNDKSLEKVLPLFPKSASYYFAKADIPRGMPAKVLQAQAADYQLIGRTYSSVKNALRAAKRHAQPDDLIFVGGSIFVVAEVI